MLKRLLRVHFEENFTVIKNMWVTNNSYLSKVVNKLKCWIKLAFN